MKYVLIPGVFFVLCFSMFMYGLSNPRDVDIVKLKYGRISKVEFEDHSYLVWQQNMSDCIIHDQNCKCLKNK
jgi:hypothetical protein